MKSIAAVVLLLAAFSSAAGRNTTSTPPAQTDTPKVYNTTRARIAIARSVHVPADEEVTEGVVVIGGSARIDGRVRDGVVVVGGNLDFGAQADVRGEIVVVGGRITRAPGAQIRGPVTDVSFGEWRNWSLAGVDIPTVHFGDVGRWFSLLGTAIRVGLLALLMAFVTIVARAPVARVGRSAAAAPGRAFAIGFLAELLFVPALIIVSVSLMITIIGIPLLIILLPVAALGAVVALLLGFTGLVCRLGEVIEDRLGWRANSVFLALAIGLLLVVGPTMVARLLSVAPGAFQSAGIGLLTAGLVIEFVVWTIGLGATLMTGFGRWSTVPPPPPPSAAQPSILPVTN